MTDCVHLWKIEPPNGETSEGICDYCQEKKDFKNSNYGDPKGSPWHKAKEGSWKHKQSSEGKSK